MTERQKMGALPKTFYPLAEVCDCFKRSLHEVAVMAIEGQMHLSVAVASLWVEAGVIEPHDIAGSSFLVMERRRISGLFELGPDDSWAILRNGSHTISWLEGPGGELLRLMPLGDDASGYVITRDEIVLRSEELLRWQEAVLAKASVIEVEGKRRRGVQGTHDWRAIERDAGMHMFYDGVPESKAELIRWVQAHLKDAGRPVPDASTLTRELKHLWNGYAAEARKKSA